MIADPADLLSLSVFRRAHARDRNGRGDCNSLMIQRKLESTFNKRSRRAQAEEAEVIA